MKREGSALRAIGRLHSRAHGRRTSGVLTPMRLGPTASASTNRKPMTSSLLTRRRQAKTAIPSSTTRSGIPT